MESPTISPPDRFNCLIEGLFGDIATRAFNVWFPLLPAELLLFKLIWRRLRRMRRRFAAIVAQLRAGTLPAPGGAPSRPTTERPAPAKPATPSTPHRRSGWVIYAVSWFVWGRHYELAELLDDPETADLVAAAPQLGSVLRPLCQMLKVKPPAWLRRPRQPRPRGPRFPPAPEWLVNEPGAILHPDGSVWMRLGGSTQWTPGSGFSYEEALKFDRPRRIWPR